MLRNEATDSGPYFPVFPVLILKLMAGTMSSAVSTTLFVCTTFTVSTILSVSTEVGVAYFEVNDVGLDATLACANSHIPCVGNFGPRTQWSSAALMLRDTRKEIMVV